MPFQPGNRYGKGRPPRFRSLAEGLRRALLKSSVKDVPNLDQLCDDVVAMLVTRQYTTAGGTITDLSVREWFDIWTWLAGHVDGPPPQQLDLLVDRPPDGTANIPVDLLEQMLGTQLQLAQKYFSDEQLQDFVGIFEEQLQPVAKYLPVSNCGSEDDGGTDE